MTATLSESAITVSICRALKRAIRNSWRLNRSEYGHIFCPPEVRRPTDSDA
jgi:hypothetical protein